jgi:PST family polysaccharide transporter
MSSSAPEHVAPRSLRGLVLGGLAWKGVSQVIAQGSRLAVGIILAYLLTPAQFGVAGMALAISSLAAIFADPALGAALVRMPTITEEDRSTVFWTNAAVGLLCTVVGVALSGVVAGFYGEPSVMPLFAVESTTFFLIGLSTIQAAILRREMSFRSLELREIGSTLAGAAVGISMAFAGFGAWAIIAQSVSTTGISTLLLWVLSPWRPRFIFSRESLRETGSFGIKMFASRALASVNGNADNILVGRFLGMASLGLYAFAYNLMYTPITRITVPIQDVLVPAFARVQEDKERLAQAWLRGNRALAAVMVPAMLGMIVVAPDLVRGVFPHRWAGAAPVVQLLCCAGLIQCLQTLQLSVLQATGHAGTVLRFMIVSTTLNVTAFVLGLRWGIIGVAACFAVSRTLALPLVTIMTTRIVGLSAAQIVRSLLGVFQASAVMFATVLGTRLLLLHSIGPALRVAVIVPLGIVAYASYSWWRVPEIMVELRGLRSRTKAEMS